MSKASSDSILNSLLDKYSIPSFGHLPKREIDLLFFEAMVECGRVSENPTVHEVITALKVTRSKARSLLYDRDLRRLDEKNLDEMIREALCKPILHKQGDLFALEIENPYVQDRVRHILREAKHLTDGSFGAGIIRLNASALTALLSHYVENKNDVKNALRKAGAPTGGFSDVLRGAVKALGKKLASEAGEKVAEEAGEYLESLLSGTPKMIVDTWTSVFDDEDAT